MVSQIERDKLVVEAGNLTKVFRDFWMRTKARAVDGVTFEIRPNEIFGLLGPNGSGKSTTIKMILGLLNKTSGKLAVFGKPPSDVVVKKYIGFLPEESYLYRFLNPRETLDYYGKLFGLDRRTRKRRTDELLDMVGLSQVSQRAIGEFSKGMTRRIGIAQALINDPEFLILDEPTSGLDPIGTRQVKDLLLELRRRGKTILLSSHLLADVEDVCDRMVMLYGGKVRAQGTTDELLTDSDHTLIKTPRLTPELIERIEAIMSREGLAIESVQTPRQRLEQLFMDIVEAAQREQAENSGAEHGGATAAFLRGEEVEGADLIDALASDQVREAPVRAVEVESAAVEAEASTGPATEVLDELVNDTPAPEPIARERVADAPDAPKDVDRGVIDSLLGGDAGGDDDEDRRS